GSHIINLHINFTIMAKSIRTEIIISASPEKVWGILTKFENYPAWNPFIISLEGVVEQGNKITVTIHPPKGKGMIFKPTIIEYVKYKKLSWLGSVLFRGIFDGEHIFELIDNSNGTVTFIQSENFTGIFSSMLNLDNTKDGFILMNNKLKELSEY
ncbi:MAG: SRPBCC domain-containing protein, partial [Parabacteroides sp.]|nr:SRPBCC domain-containing protein [Parabacteroides sp.]